MTTEEEVDAFLAHWGVKGMKWGVRKDRRARNKEAYERYRGERNRAGKLTGKQRAGAGATAYLVSQAATTVTYLLTKNMKLAQLAFIPSVMVGYTFSKQSMLNNGKKKVSEIEKRGGDSKKNAVVSDAEAIRQVEEFIKKGNLNR